MANFTLKCDPNRVTKELDNTQKMVVRNLLEIVTRNLTQGAELLKSKMKESYSGGTRTAPGSLAEISGKLIRSVRVVPPQVTTDTVKGNIAVGDHSTPYAGVLIGSPRGKETEITPKNAKALAIPTKFARTSKGVPRGGPLDPMWGITFIANNMIFGYQRGTSRQYAKPVPLFILKKSVVVKTKIDLKEDVLNIIIPQIRTEVRKLFKSGDRTIGTY
jgi:hypothetical protein